MLAIIAILIALLVPAVQHVRELSARSQCQNQFRQLGIGLHAYHDAFSKFPQAYNEYWNLCEPSDQTGPPDHRPRKSWASLILPYLEQETLHFSGSKESQKVAVGVFVCPSQGALISTGGNFKHLGDQFGLTSYLAVEGSSYTKGPGASMLNLEFSGPKDGIIYRSSDTRLKDITDGRSNTLLLGERPPSRPSDLSWGWWAWSAYDAALAVVDFRRLPHGDACPLPAMYGPSQMDDPCGAHHFWSFHRNGANWLFADGSVHFLTYGARDIMPALATRQGSEQADIPF